MDLQNKIVGCVGRKGSGKSTMARRILERQPRLFVFDSMGEHSWIPNTLRSPAGVERFFAWCDDQVDPPQWAGRVVPQGDLVREFAELAELVYDQRRLVLGVEEMPMLVSPSYVPPELDKLVRLGRHREVSMVWTAQRMSEVARRLTAATDWYVLFSQREPRDLSALAERCGAGIADEVAALPMHEYIVWDAIAAEKRTLQDLLTALAVLQSPKQ